MRKKLIGIYHTDLDGYGVKVISKIYAINKGYKEEDIIFEHADYFDNNLCDKKVNDIVKPNEDEIAEVIFGDISVKNSDTAEYLNDLSKKIPIILRDHHESANWMNEYDFAKVREKDENGIFRSGTYWIAKELLSNEYIESHPNLKKFIYLVDMFDTWKWAKCNPKLSEAEDLSLAFEALTEEGFDKEIYPKLLLEEKVDLFDEKVKFYIDVTHRELNRNAWASYFSMQKGIYTYKDGDKEILLKVGIISTQNGSSMIIERLRDIFNMKNEQYDFIINIGIKGGFALRADENCKVPCNLIAEKLGTGGGHIGAAGGRLKDGVMKKGLETIFENMYIENFANN